MAVDFLLWGLFIVGGAGDADPPMVTATNPEGIAALLQSEGYAAKIEKTADGEPVIRSKSSGSNFAVYFYNCKDGKDCATVQFSAGYDTSTDKQPSLAKINEWNRDKRFGNAYLDEENDPIIEMDVDLDDGGMSRALFVDNFEFWTSVMAEFEKHIGW